MNEKVHISGTQFLWLLLAGRLSNCLLLPADSLHALTVPDLLMVTALNAGILLLLMLPTWLLLRHTEDNLTDLAAKRGCFGEKAVCGGYLLLSVFVLFLDMLQFKNFAEHTVKPDFSVVLLCATLLAAGFAAALYGVQALARTAAVVAVVGVALLFIFSALLIPQMERVNLPPAQFSGLKAVLWQTVKELPRTAEIAAVGALYPVVRGKAGMSYAGFVGATAVLSLLVCMVTTAVLGDYAGMTAYPFYTAVTAAKVGTLERLDLPVVTLWLGTFFIRIALFATVFLQHAQRLFGERAGVPAAVLGAAAVFLLTALSQNGTFAGQWRVVTVVYWGVLAVFLLGLPLLVRKAGKRVCAE